MKKEHKIKTLILNDTLKTLKNQYKEIKNVSQNENNGWVSKKDNLILEGLYLAINIIEDDISYIKYTLN